MTIILPVFNEVNTIASAIANLKKVLETSEFTYEVIIVESGSTDGTHEYIKSISNSDSRIHTKFQSTPRGKGNAVRYGLTFASGEIVSIYDGDEEYDPRDLLILCAAFKNPDVQFVLGSRHDKSRPMRTMERSKVRARIMNIAHYIFTQMINLTFSLKLKDPFTMYKLFRKDLFENIDLFGDRFDFDWELVCKAARMGVVPLEIPVSYISRDFESGKKVLFFKDPATWIVMLIKCRFYKL